MPILDVQVQVNDAQIDYKFYKKSMSNHRVMLARSAMPGTIKIASLTQEVIRRLRNTRRSLDWSVKADILSLFSHSLMVSGYPESFRLEVLQAGVKGYQAQCDRHDNGGQPLHRPRSYNSAERTKKKAIVKTAWYRPYDSVIFIPSTPGGKLAKMYRSVIDEEFKRIGLRIKVVETGGVSLTRQLFKTDSSGCLVPRCLLCKSGKPGASHTRSSAEYQGECLLCGANNVLATYDGESGFCCAYRADQHASDIRSQDTSNAFAKHLNIYHPDNVGDVDAFTFKSVKTFKKTLERQVYEGVMINRSKADIRMNSKAEWHQPSEIRVNFTRSLEPEERTRSRSCGS